MLDTPAVISSEDALAQPTRARLFSLLAELARPATTLELAARLDMHHNGVRSHLERLEQAGLVVRDRAPRPRGRPPAAWSLAPGARPGGRAPTAYQDLGRWLARAIRVRSTGARGIETVGRQIGRELAAGEHRPLEGMLASLGFQPSVSLRDGDRLELRLANCPYRAAVRENQPAICALHRGITRGLIELAHPGAELVSFVPEDPDVAGCRVMVHGLRATAPEAPCAT